MDKRKGLLKQAAEKMLQLHEENKGHRKRAHAIQLLYKQAEMGYGRLPSSHNEFEEKIASLIKQDLKVVEKALEITGGHAKLGEVENENIDPLAPQNANQAFEAQIIGN